MLYLSLVSSLVIVGFAFYAARRPPHPIRWGEFLGGAGVVTALTLCGFASVPPLVLFPALLLALGAWALARHRVRWFFPFAATAFLVAYGPLTWIAVEDTRRYARLREQFPVESMAERVPEPRPAGDRVPVSQAAGHRLDELDKQVVELAGNDWKRTAELMRLHTQFTQKFVNAPGFGQMRMLSGRVNEARLRPVERSPDPPNQPGSPFRPTGSDADGPPKEIPSPTFYDLHARGVLDFVNPAGFGFIKDRRHVAGFQPHAFSEIPAAPEKWTVERVELIGLLLNPDPVVYLSEQLPAMDRLRAVPIRRLDEVEQAGLAALRKGEDLHTVWAAGRLRMVGSLRNGNQCLGCHGGERADLLGAFSYSVRVADER